MVHKSPTLDLSSPHPHTLLPTSSRHISLGSLQQYPFSHVKIWKLAQRFRLKWVCTFLLAHMCYIPQTGYLTVEFIIFHAAECTFFVNFQISESYFFVLDANRRKGLINNWIWHVASPFSLKWVYQKKLLRLLWNICIQILYVLCIMCSMNLKLFNLKWSENLYRHCYN
jgi:hypothetical protein